MARQYVGPIGSLVQETANRQWTTPGGTLVEATSGAYTLALDPGAYAQTGTVAGLLFQRTLVAAPGSYTQTGTAAGLLFKHTLTAVPGSYTQTGTTAALNRGRMLTAVGGTYALSGTAAGLLFKRTLVAVPGSYAQTGTAVTLTKASLSARVLTVAPGTYALSGTALAFRQIRVLATPPGSYTLTGSAGVGAVTNQDTGLLRRLPVPPKDRLIVVAGPVEIIEVSSPIIVPPSTTTYALTVASGYYPLIGQPGDQYRDRPAGLALGSYGQTGNIMTSRRGGGTSRIVAAGSGFVALSGVTPTLRRTYRLPVSPSNYAATGIGPTLRQASVIARTMGATPGAETYTGTALAFRFGYRLIAAAGAYAQTGSATTLTRGGSTFNRLAVVVGQYTRTGTSTALKYNRRLSAAVGSYAVAGGALAAFRRGTKVVVGSYAVTGAVTALKLNRKLTVAIGSYAAAGTTASLRAGHKASLASGSYAVTGSVTALRSIRRLTAAAGSFALIGGALTMRKSSTVTRTLGASPATYTRTGTALGFRRTYRMVASPGSYTRSGTAATLTRSSSPGTMRLDSSFAEVSRPKVFTVLGRTGNLTSSDLPINVSSETESPYGIHLRTSNNTIQFNGQPGVPAGSRTFHVSDGTATVALTIDVRMWVMHPQCEVTAPVKGLVGWLFGVPAGVTPTLSHALFELASWDNGDERLWWVRIKATPTIGTHTVSISAPGLTTITADIAVIADTGLHTSWPEPVAPAAPAAPTRTITSSVTLVAGAAYDRFTLAAGVSLGFKDNGVGGWSLTNGSGDGCGMMGRQYAGDMFNVTIDKIRVVNGTYKQGIGMGIYRASGTGAPSNVSVTNIYWQSTTALATSESDIFSVFSCIGKDPAVNFGGNWTFAYIYGSGLRMASVSSTGAAIPFPNEDGGAFEMFTTQTGPGNIHDTEIRDSSDAGLDIKCPLGTVISRHKTNDVGECFKDWNCNTWEYVKATNTQNYQIIRNQIPAEIGGRTSRRFGPGVSVVRQFYTSDATGELVKFDIGKGAIAFQKWDIPAALAKSRTTSAALGSIMINPAGQVLEMTSLLGYVAHTIGSTAFASLTITSTNSTYSRIMIHATGEAPPTSGGCAVEFRVKGQTTWRSGIYLPYDDGVRNGAQALTAEYRGSIHFLDPGTTYEFRLQHDDGTYSATYEKATRVAVSALPIASTINQTSRSTTLNITSGGTSSGYIKYKPTTGRATIDVSAAGTRNYAMQVTGASYLIFENIDFVGALKHNVLLGTSVNSNSDVVKNIIFLNCTGTAWGSPPPAYPSSPYAENLQSAIFSASTALENITVRGCYFYSPTLGSNTWYIDEGNNPDVPDSTTGSQHPEGSQAICFKNSMGGHVFEWSTFDGLSVHFNDSAGETNNFSDAGCPNRDSDFIGLVIRNCCDDGLEIEGRSENIWIDRCIFDEVYHAIGTAPVYRGPVDVTRCIGRISRSGSTRARGQSFFKSRQTGADPNIKWSRGKVRAFNCTLLPPVSGQLGFQKWVNEESSTEELDGWRFQNCLADAFDGTASITATAGTDVTVISCVATNAPILNAAATKVNLIAGPASYSVFSWNASTGIGSFRLSSSSPGYAQGTPIGNLNEGVANPDCGAHQHGDSPVGYGHLNVPA